MSDADFAAIVKRYEDAGDVQNADIIRKQREVARAPHGFLVTDREVLFEPAPAVTAPCVVEVQGKDESDRRLPGEFTSAEALFEAMGVNDRIGKAITALTKTQAAETLSVMLWPYRRLPHGYGQPPMVEQPILRLAKEAGIDVANCLAERGPTQNENEKNGGTNERT